MRVIVVGAGFAGLAAAEALHTAGHDVRVFEARDRVGGRVGSQPMPDGTVIERGAEFILPGNTVMHETAARLGLDRFEKGTTYGNREPRGGIGVTPAELQDALDLIANAGASESLEGDTATALAALPITPGAREAIIARLEVTSAYPVSDQQARMMAGPGKAFGNFPSTSIAGGNDRIAKALATRLGDRVECDAPVPRVAWSNDDVTVSVGAHSVSADRCVLAIPASVFDQIIFDPPLPEWKQTAIAGVRYGQAAKLFLPLAKAASPSATLAVPHRFWSYTQLLPDGRLSPIVSSFAGSPECLQRLELDRGPATWANQVANLRPDLALDIDGALLSTWQDDPWVRGAYSVNALSSPLDTIALQKSVGPLSFAGEHTAGEFRAEMEGALRSGHRAARELIAAAQIRTA